MYASNGGSMNLSQGTANNYKDGRSLNEPWWFRQTLGQFGSIIVNK